MKTVFITGASSGIGKAIAEYLSRKGFQVIGTSRNSEFKSTLFETLPLDVTSQESVDNAYQSVIKRYSKVDILINNAGYGIFGSIEGCSIEEAQAQFETNYFGVVRVTKKFLPHFRENQSGIIINIGSIAGLISLPFQGHYSASKFALEGFTEALRFEVEKQNIRVCLINPGDFNTGFTANRKIVSKDTKVYKERENHFLSIYEHDESNGSDPKKIAFLVDRIINKNAKPGIRYPIGMPLQTAAVYIKRWLGGNLFEKILKIVWK